MVESTELEKQIGDLEVAIDRLRSLYEQYFMGIEKIEPGVPRKDVDRKIYALRKEQIRNTALRFRFQMILQRYNTFQTHWQRICREIENGTYKRHLLRAERSAQQTPPPAARKTSRPAPPSSRRPEAPGQRDLAAELAELDKDFAPPTSRGAPVSPRSAPPSPRGATPPPRPPPRHAPAAATATKRPSVRPDDPGLPEYRIRQLYVEYVEAKRRQNESTASVTYNGLAQSLRDSSNRLKQKHGKAVDFEVSVKDGKAILKPVLKK